jgi:V/A-type H+-transporting ATPase subunit C
MLLEVMIWIITGIAIVVIGMISRPFITQVVFAYPTAKFEAIGNPFVKEKELNNLLECKDLNAFKDTLNSMRDYNIVGEDSNSIQKSLDTHFVQTVEMMRKDSPKKMRGFYDVYLEKMDVHLIKSMLKKIYKGEEEVEKVILERYYGIPLESKEIDHALLESTRDFLRKLKDADKESLPAILKSHGLQEVIDKPELIDVIIDKRIIEKLKKVEVPYNCEEAKQRFVNHMIDIINIKNVLRAKQLGYDAKMCKKLFVGEGQEIAFFKLDELAECEYVPQVISALEGTSYFGTLKDSIEEYNKEKSIQVFEKVLDAFFLRIVGDISLQYYSNIGPTIRFLVSKEFEIRNLKAIAKGIYENLPPDIIKSFLVMEAKK